MQLKFPGPELRQHACASVLRQAEEVDSSAVRAAAPEQPQQSVFWTRLCRAVALD